MTPIKAVRLLLGEMLAADTTIIGPVAPNKVVLIANDFTPSENLVAGDLTQATFDGNTPKAIGATPQLAGTDPVTGEQIVTMKEPAGGWVWEMTGLTVPEETIFGYAIFDTALTTLVATGLLPTPVTLNEVGQQIDLGSVTFRVVLDPLS